MSRRVKGGLLAGTMLIAVALAAEVLKKLGRR
jgi:hypothetical protein